MSPCTRWRTQLRNYKRLADTIENATTGDRGSGGYHATLIAELAVPRRHTTTAITWPAPGSPDDRRSTEPGPYWYSRISVRCGIRQPAGCHQLRNTSVAVLDEVEKPRHRTRRFIVACSSPNANIPPRDQMGGTAAAEHPAYSRSVSDRRGCRRPSCEQRCSHDGRCLVQLVEPVTVRSRSWASHRSMQASRSSASTGLVT